MTWAYEHVERIRFGDLDAMRHLNNVVFLRYFESARIAYLMHVLDDHDPADPDSGTGFILASNHIDYRSPGHFDEEVAVRVRPADVGTKSFRLEFEMRVGERVLAEGYGVIVAYDYASQRSTPLPEPLKQRLGAPVS